MARAYAKRLEADLVVIDKRRPRQNVAEVMNIIGDVQGKNILIVDDLIDTGGTLCNAVRALKEAGAADVYAACTHPVLSGKAIRKDRASPASKTMLVTDTLALTRAVAEGRGGHRRAHFRRGHQADVQAPVDQFAVRRGQRIVNTKERSACPKSF